MISIANCLKQAEIPGLDAEILLSHVLNESRLYLYTYPEELISESMKKKFEEFVLRRKSGEPAAYITGRREFWSLDLTVSSDVLIPRPETELLVELALKLGNPKCRLADLGTGSGAVALAISKEKPNWEIYATDKSEKALALARLNAERLNLTGVNFHQGHWCQALPPLQFDLIVSNPPYIAAEDPHLQELTYEPRSALIADNQGLKDIAEIIYSAKGVLRTQGWLLIEHGFNQAEKVGSYFADAGYEEITHYRDLSGLERVTAGRAVL